MRSQQPLPRGHWAEQEGWGREHVWSFLETLIVLGVKRAQEPCPPLLVPLATLQSAASSQPSAQALALPAAPSAWPQGVILDERLGVGWRGLWTIQVMPHFTEVENEDVGLAWCSNLLHKAWHTVGA